MNGSGTGELLDALTASFPPGVEKTDDGILKIALIGRPNVGKSSLTNALLGEDRAIVTEIAGTTRDALDTPLRHFGRDLVLVDTAGLRRRSKVSENVEFYSTLRTQRAIERCDVACLLIEGPEGLQAQDISVLKEAESMKKGLIIIVNKWDLVEKETNTARDYAARIHERLQTLDYVPILFVSALTKQRVGRVLEEAVKVGDERVKRVSTSKLNEMLEEATHAPHAAAVPGRERQDQVRHAGARGAAGDRVLRQPPHGRPRELPALSRTPRARRLRLRGRADHDRVPAEVDAGRVGQGRLTDLRSWPCLFAPS